MRLPVLVLLVIALAVPAAHADDRHLVIGTKQTPPFAMKNDDGAWTGLSIELWKHIADELHVTYEIKEYDIKGLLAAVEAKQVDVAVASLTITAERETRMDFTHPMFSSGLAIATRPGGSAGTLAAMKSLLTWDSAKVLGGLLALLLFLGTLVWLFERRRNDAQFAKEPARGIAAGVWWSAVTMTTVGYGDKAPVTVAGRILGFVWMFTAIIIISIFTASITTALTVDRLESAIKGPDDLPRYKVVTVASSTSAAYLTKHGIAFSPVATIDDGMKAVARDEADAMVYDAPVLQYLAKKSYAGAVDVVPNVFDRQDYGFAVPDGSPLREEINRVLLRELTSDDWADLQAKYLGQSS
jgi:polar amino acid transport system substrate-binding protein